MPDQQAAAGVDVGVAPGRRLNRNIGLFFAGFAGLVLILSTRSAIKRSRRGEYVNAR